MAGTRNPKRTIRTIQDYQKAIGAEAFSDFKNLRSVKSYIEKNLFAQKSKLQDFLRQLPYESKIDFTIALIMNDEEKIADYLFQGVEKNRKDEPVLKYLRYAAIPSTAGKNDIWLSNTTCRIIANMLYRPNKITKMTEAEKKEFLSSVMSKIPDSFLSLQAKKDIGKQIDKSQVGLRVAYSESVRPMSASKDSGKISFEKYKKATQIAKLDMSEFIFLTLGVLHKFLNSHVDVNPEIAQIRQLYVDGNFDEAHQRLSEFCAEYQDYIGEDVFAAISKAAIKSEKIDLNTNYSRRFFENKLAAIFSGRNMELEVINHIIKHVRGPSFTPVTTNLNAIAALADLSELSDNKLLKRMEELQKLSSTWPNRGRVRKPGLVSKFEESLGTASDSIYTRNLGVMKSLQPNYNDELSQQPIRNASADMYIASDDKTTYPHNHSGAYTASISGHAYFMAALLEKYIAEDLTNVNMEFNINNFIKSFAIAFVSRGYHGLNEVLDVFREPQIVAIFKTNGINLHLDWANDLLKIAFNETQAYTKTICIKKSLHEELLHKATSISEIIEKENLPLLKRLIKGGAVEVDAALAVAAMHGKENIIKYLMQQGGDVNVLNNNSPKPMESHASPKLQSSTEHLLFKSAKRPSADNEGESVLKKGKRGKAEDADEKAVNDLLNFLNNLNRPNKP